LRIARTLVRALLIGTVSVGIVVPATVAAAAPSPADLQRQIDDASNNLEKIVEQYNRVTEELKATTAAQAALTAQLAPLQAGMDAAYSAVQDIAVKAFEGAPLSTGAALLQAGSPTDLLDQLGALDQIGRQRRTEIAGYEQAKSKYDAQKKQLDGTQAAQTAQQQQLDAQKTKINSDLQALYALRTQAFGRPTDPPAKSNATPPAVSGSAGVAVRYAYSALGVPYVWAGETMGGFDCSGLTKAAWGAAGRSLPHNAAMQWSAVAHIGRGDLRPGDLVFYNGLGHVGIFVGGNQIIHAPHAGTVVQLASVDIMRPYGFGRVR
jgi:cell wall-associated NlpC family hydrolase